MDSIINFGENLPEATLERAMEEGRKVSAACFSCCDLPGVMPRSTLVLLQADLCLTMGSSLTVTPAADIPAAIGRRR